MDAGPDEDPFTPQPSQPTATAQLSAESSEGWVGEPFTFDASGSTATESELTTWRFDFGDNETIEVTAPGEPVVQHNYTAAGTYSVNLTVEAQADGGNASSGAGDAITDTTTIQVSVHDRVEIPETELSSGLLGGGPTENHTLPVEEGAVNFTAFLDFESDGFFDSEGTVRVLGPDGDVLAEEAFNLSSGEQANITLNGDLSGTGDHYLEVELTDGDVIYSGRVDIYYGLDSASQGSQF